MRNARWMPALTAAVAWACGGPGGDAVDENPSREGETAGAVPASDPGAIPADRAGSFVLDGTEYPFLVVRCDLTGRSPDGMLVRGGGTAPDGRRFSIEVERLDGGETVDERVSAFLGSIVDGDHWTTRRTRWPDGRWFSDEIGNDPAEGPLIRVSGNELIVDADFEHETEETSRSGVLRAACPE